MNTKRQYKTYTSEFKAEALALISEQGYSAQANSTVSSDERIELLALRKEVKILRMEKEILKKASAFFAKEMK